MQKNVSLHFLNYFMKKRVVLGLSGGVDSSVAAYILKEQGYEVIGLFMKNWHDDSVTISDECPWLDDSNDAMLVAEKLGIPFQTVDLSAEYKEKIVDYMFREYEMGRTPNPDVLCNREIKFDVFLKIALELGADYVATGHYCRKGTFVKDNKETYQLLAGKDPNKDQSYFLCQLSQEQLSKTLFPIGELLKPQVREIAKEQEIDMTDKHWEVIDYIHKKFKKEEALSIRGIKKSGVINIKEFYQFDVAQGKELALNGHQSLFDLVSFLQIHHQHISELGHRSVD